MSIKLIAACTINHDQVNSQSLLVSLEVGQDAAFGIDAAKLTDHFRQLGEVIVQTLTDDFNASPNGEDRSRSTNGSSAMP